MTKKLKVGLIGAGFIGGSHALAVNAVNRVFAGLPYEAVPTVLADADAERAQANGTRYGFRTITTDWSKAVADCDAVIIAVPSHLHREIALAAIDRGRHVLCEKPVGLDSTQASEIAAAAAKAGISNAVGFTYMRVPLVRHTKRLLADGTLGKPLHFRGRHCEDYLADPRVPFSWRLDAARAGRCGALGDLGWHILSIARCLCGPVTELSGSVRTFRRERPLPDEPGSSRAVENEDWAGLSLRFESGCSGLIDVSRIAHGRRMDIGFELVCENGTIAFDGERWNEMRLYTAANGSANQGFTTILANADHPDYGNFIPAPGHGLGFNDLQTIELKDFLEAIAAGRNADPDLEEACRIARICEAVIESSEQHCWIPDPEMVAAGTGTE